MRGLFIDLNLSGSSSIRSSTHYAEITRILETVISCDNGPFIMILWTDNPQECDQLIEYIETRLDPEKNIVNRYLSNHYLKICILMLIAQ